MIKTPLVMKQQYYSFGLHAAPAHRSQELAIKVVPLELLRKISGGAGKKQPVFYDHCESHANLRNFLIRCEQTFEQNRAKLGKLLEKVDFANENIGDLRVYIEEHERSLVAARVDADELKENVEKVRYEEVIPQNATILRQNVAIADKAFAATFLRLQNQIQRISVYGENSSDLKQKQAQRVIRDQRATIKAVQQDSLDAQLSLEKLGYDSLVPREQVEQREREIKERIALLREQLTQALARQ